MTKKILVILPFSFYQPSGSSLNSFYRVKALLALNNKVDVLTYPFGEMITGPKLKIFRSQTRKVFKTFQPGEYKKKIVLDLFMLWKYLSLILRNNYDLIFIHGSLLYLAILIKPFIQSKLIANAHGNLGVDLQKWNVTKKKVLIKLSSKIEAFIFEFYDKIICIHESVREALLKNGVNSKKITVIKNSVFNKSTLNKTNRKQKDKFIILYAGTFVKIQNLTLIYQTARKISDENIEFWLVGGIEKELENEKKLIKKYQVESKVKLFTRRSQRELEDFYKKADVVISPRIFGHDTPMKIIEYLNYGKCILASDAPIHTEVLNANNSYLTTGEPESFNKAIIFLKENPEEIINKGKKAKEYFEKYYSFEIMTRKYRKILEEFK